MTSFVLNKRGKDTLILIKLHKIRFFIKYFLSLLEISMFIPMEKIKNLIFILIIILEVLAGVMVFLGIKNDMLPPILTGVGFVIISITMLLIFITNNKK